MTTVANLLRVKADSRVHTIAPQATVYEAIALMDRSSRSTVVQEVMSTPVKYVRPHQSVEECMRLMTNSRLRHLPVIEDDKLIGLVSIGDLVKSIISEQQFIIEQLEHYITGSRSP